MEVMVHLSSIEQVPTFLTMPIKRIVVGSTIFSCRQALSLSYLEIEQIVRQSKDKADIYILVNALIEEHKIEQLEAHLTKLVEIGVAGILFQDFGVLQICREKQYSLDCIYAPDTLNTNQETLSFLKTRGIGGAFLAREIPLLEKRGIQQHVDMPCVMQIHGVEYMAQSKRQLLKNYYDTINQTMSDKAITIKANGVEDSCHIYEDENGTHILTNRQLCCLDVIDQMLDISYGYIESLYIEPKLYIEIVRLYLQAIDESLKGNYHPEELMKELYQVDPAATYHHSFLFDQTVYKISDVRKREENES